MMTVYQKLQQLEHLYQKRKARNERIERNIKAYQELKKIIEHMEFELFLHECKLMVPILVFPLLISKFFFLNEIPYYFLLMGTIVGIFVDVKSNWKRKLCKKIGLFSREYTAYEEWKQKENSQKPHIERLQQFLEVAKLKEQYLLGELQTFQMQASALSTPYHSALEELENEYQSRKRKIEEEKDAFLRHYTLTVEEMNVYEQMQEEKKHDLQKRISNLKNRRL